MINKEKRKQIRVPLLNEICEWKIAHAIDGYESKLIDFSPYGCFIHSTFSIPINSYILMHFKLPGDLGVIPVYGRVRWQHWALRKKDINKKQLGFGVEFVDVKEGPQKILDSYGVYLRNKQIIAVSKRIIEEFFGNVPPTVRR